MKALLAAAALAGLLVLSGCAAASTPPAGPAAASPSGMAEAQSSASAAAAPTLTAQASGPLEGKVHYKGDYAQVTPENSADVIEVSRQWYSAEKKAALKAKMDAAGLSSNIPAEAAPTWYATAAVSCQAKFDGHPLPVEGTYAQINTLILSTYCPELG